MQVFGNELISAACSCIATKPTSIVTAFTGTTAQISIVEATPVTSTSTAVTMTTDTITSTESTPTTITFEPFENPETQCAYAGSNPIATSSYDVSLDILNVDAPCATFCACTYISFHSAHIQ